MRGINYTAGLGTILIFLGIFCLKAVNTGKSRYSNRKYNGILIAAGIVAIISGVLLILKALKII